MHSSTTLALALLYVANGAAAAPVAEIDSRGIGSTILKGAGTGGLISGLEDFNLTYVTSFVFRFGESYLI